MVYSCIKDGYVKGISVSCNCGCCIFEFRVSGNDVFISSYNSDWYGHQSVGTIRDKISHAFNAVKGKKNQVLCEVIMDGDDIDKFIKLAKELEFDEEEDDNSSNYENDSHLVLDCSYLGDTRKSACYALEIRSDLSIMDTIRHEHRGYEICLKKKDWVSLINKMDAYLNIMDEKHLSKA